MTVKRYINASFIHSFTQSSLNIPI